MIQEIIAFMMNSTLGLSSIIIICVLISLLTLKRQKREIKQSSTVLIVGPSKGLGSDLAILIASAHKCNIVWLSNDSQGSKALLSLIKFNGGQGHFHKCDFQDRNMIFRTMAEIVSVFPTIDLFINIGGVALEKDLNSYSYEEIATTMKVNLYAPMIITKELIPIMKANGGGQIVNVPSYCETTESPDILTCGLKGGLTGFFNNLRWEMERSDSNIQIISISPSFTMGNKSRSHQNQEKESYLGDRMMSARRIYEEMVGQAYMTTK